LKFEKNNFGEIREINKFFECNIKMISVNHGLEYFIVLNSNINEFDFIPDIEKSIRKHVYYKTVDIDGNEEFILLFIYQHESDERLLRSSYYKENADAWFDGEHRRKLIISINQDLVQDMHLSDKEQEQLKKILTIMDGHVKATGWYDVFRYD
jgi:hypothetical protein